MFASILLILYFLLIIQQKNYLAQLLYLIFFIRAIDFIHINKHCRVELERLGEPKKNYDCEVRCG